jgi:hypothetical protein
LTIIRTHLLQIGLGPQRNLWLARHRRCCEAGKESMNPRSWQKAKVNGAELEFLDHGNGEPIVFVHGSMDRVLGCENEPYSRGCLVVLQRNLASCLASPAGLGPGSCSSDSRSLRIETAVCRSPRKNRFPSLLMSALTGLMSVGAVATDKMITET